MIISLIVIIWIVEIFVNFLLGNVVDNIKSCWGKFKFWFLVGILILLVLFVIFFMGFFGLIKVNWFLYVIVFVLIFIIMDVFYVFVDVFYWGMVLVLSEDSYEWLVYILMGIFVGFIGWNGLMIIVVLVVIYFIFFIIGKYIQGGLGWFVFVIIIGLLVIICVIFVIMGIMEKDDLIWFLVN